MVYGTLPGVVYPFLFNYLNMEGTQVVSAVVLLNMPWSFKLFFGMITDCFPIRGAPYFPDTKYATMDKEELTPEIIATFNESAHHAGSKFVVLMMFAAIGYVGADVAADGLMVEVAQREPEATRGYTQTTIYMVRTAFVMISSILTGVVFNGKHYGGDFDFSLSFPQLMTILTIYCLPVIPISWYFIEEELHPGVVFRQYFDELWKLIQTRPMYQVIAYKFLAGVFENFSTTCSDPMQRYWAEVTPLNEKLMIIVGNGVFTLTLYCTGKYGLQWNWRKMHAITIILVTMMDFTVTMLTTWDVVRSQWFWLGVPVAEALPNGIAFVIATFVMVELAGEGNEGAVYGLVGSISNIAIPLASTLTKNVNSQFDVSNADIVDDSHHVRWEVTYVLIIRYTMNLAGLLFLPLLPRQKAETQILKQKSRSSRVMGIVTLTYFTIALFWTVLVNLLSVSESTSCHWIAGGSGCNSGNTHRN
ncbi:Transmembrane protein [Phytophthora megakarya]|uniref:Transmembrane protein n=1 Tax=Phytophthora megakarya TaxID=4795 RepID=A0A225X3U4_9STRA|nr:Transmembrane protein [Phytophthora megakarya]